MTHSPLASDVAHARLHALGWSVGSTALAGPSGLAWVVTGHRMHVEDLIRADGGTEASASGRAVEQAGGPERPPMAS